MNNAANMLVRRQLGSYQTDLDQWTRRVTTTRDDRDAFRLASQAPAPGSLIRSLGSLTGPHKRRAEGTVERHLEERLDRLERDGAEVGLLRGLQRSTQGHFPRLARRLDGMARKAARPSEPEAGEGMEP
jgi:hypothetical protein